MLSDQLIEQLKEILREHSGDAQVYIHLNEDRAVKLSDEFCVDTSNGLIPELRVLLGADAIVL
jgi:DNA polymerase III subunit alpha